MHRGEFAHGVRLPRNAQRLLQRGVDCIDWCPVGSALRDDHHMSVGKQVRRESGTDFKLQ